MYRLIDIATYRYSTPQTIKKNAFAQKSVSACTNTAPDTAALCLLATGKKSPADTSTAVSTVLLHPTSSTRVRTFGPIEHTHNEKYEIKNMK